MTRTNKQKSRVSQGNSKKIQAGIRIKYLWFPSYRDRAEWAIEASLVASSDQARTMLIQML